MVKRVATSHPNIVRYPNGDLYYRGMLNGKRQELKLNTKKQRTAEKEVLKLGLRTDLDAKDEVINNFIGDIIPEFLVWKKNFVGHADPKRNITSETYKEYEDLFELYLTPFYGHKSLESLNDVTGDNEEKLWLTFKDSITIQIINIRKVWMAFKKWAYERGHIRKIGTCAKPNYKVKAGRILDPEELQAVLEQASKHRDLFLFVLMGATMAMRRGEMIKLSWDRVLFKDKAIITKARGSRTKTVRTLPINDEVLEILKERRESFELDKKLKDSPYVFPNKRDPMRHADVSGLKKAWKQAFLDAEIKGNVTPHDLRRTWAVYANLDSSLTDMQREKFAGHSKDIQREHYALLQAKHLKPLTEVVKIPELTKLVSKYKKNGGQFGGNGGNVK